jgi:hypothetical protein
MDEVNALPASEHEHHKTEIDADDISKEIKYQSPDNEDGSSSSSTTHSTSGVISASSPGSQRDFYSHVSGAGDGYPLQTSDGARPRLLTDLTMEDGSLSGPVIVRSSAAEFEENNITGVNLRDISKDWSNKVQRLNRTINAILKHIPEPSKVDVTVGKTPIHRDKAVVLAWNKKQQKLNESLDSGLFSPTGVSSDIKFAETQDGIVLYCAIRIREEFQDSTDTETSATKDIFRQACSSPDHVVPKINLDAFDLGDKLRSRFRSPDSKYGERKSPRSRRSPRRSPTKGSPRKSSSGDEKGTEGTSTSTSSDLDDDEYITETENDEYRHRKGVGIQDDDDYRIMRSRERDGSPKKSVRWTKEVDGKDSSAERDDTGSKRDTKYAPESNSRNGSRESSATSPRRVNSGESRKADDDSPKDGSRRGSMSPRRRGSSDSKASSTSPRRRGSSESKGIEEGGSKSSSSSSSRRSSGEQSPRRKSDQDSKRGSTENVLQDQNDYGEGREYSGREVYGYGSDKDSGTDQNGKSDMGARSRTLKRDDDNSNRRRYRREHDGGRQFTDGSYDDHSLGDERKLYLHLDGSATSNEKERLIRRQRTALRRRRRRAEQLKIGEPFDTQISESEGDTGEKRPRTAKDKHRLNELRRKYLDLDIDAIDDEEYKEIDPDFDHNGDERHDTCFLPFVGYNESYDGPIGILTSKLPDGSSTAGTLFTSFHIHRRKSSIAFLDFYDLQFTAAAGIYHKKST